MPVALEYDGDELPALVGMIIACFAAIERELPGVIARVTGMTQQDTVMICAEFRAFSARLGILEAVLKTRDDQSHDKIIFSHCKGLFNEANKIRNKYAHALFAKGHEMRMLPYHHDWKAPDQWVDMGPEARADRKRIAVILGELFAILHQKDLPQGLYDKLLPQDR